MWGCRRRRRNRPVWTDSYPGCLKQRGRAHDGSCKWLGAGSRGGRRLATSEMAGEVGDLAGVVAAGVGGNTVGDRQGWVLPGAVGGGRQTGKTTNVLLRPAGAALAADERARGEQL